MAADSVVSFRAMADSFSNPSPQFGTAEYLGKPGNDHCQFCHQPIAGNYYRINNAMACGGGAVKNRGPRVAGAPRATRVGPFYGHRAARLGVVVLFLLRDGTGAVICLLFAALRLSVAR